MAMAAKVAERIAQEIAPLRPGNRAEAASDADRKQINKFAKQFLDAFEADYREKIKERKREK